MEEMDEQDISKGKSPYNDNLGIGGAEEYTPPSRPIDDNGDNDNDKNGIFESLLAIQLLILKTYLTDAQRFTIYTPHEPVGCRFQI